MKHTINQPAQQQNLYAQLQEEARLKKEQQEAAMAALVKQQEAGIAQ
jgi:hypothetical protein